MRSSDSPASKGLAVAGLLGLAADHVRLLAVSISLLLSVWKTYTDEAVNHDGVRYLQTVERLLSGNWEGAYELYNWLFYPALIAMLGRVSGLDPEASARVLNALLSALLVFSFLTLIRDLGGDRKVLLIAAFVILFHPSLLGNRAEIIRDHGYWACYLLSVLFFLRYYRQPCWRYALAWSTAMVLAILFRIEGVVLLLLLPAALWLRRETAWCERWRFFLQANGMLAILSITGFILIAANPEILAYPGRLYEPIQMALEFWNGLTVSLGHKAEQLGELVLGPFLKDYALLALYVTLTLVLLGKAIHILTPLYSILPWFRVFHGRLVTLTDIGWVLAWLLFLNLAIAAVSLVNKFLISGRFLVPFALTALIVIPFVLASVHDQWLLRRRQPLRQRWIFLAILAGLIIIAGDSLISFGGTSKAYLQEAGLWLREHAGASFRLYTNNRRVAYYSGQSVSYEDEMSEQLGPKWRLTEPMLREVPWQDYDYLALWIDRKSPLNSQQVTEILGMEPVTRFENRKTDAVIIFKVPKAGSDLVSPGSRPANP